MEALIGPFLSFLLLYKYAALFLIEFGAAFAFPLPAGTALAAAGAFVSQGYMNLYLVIAVSLLGNIGGDAAGFFLAKRYGEEILSKAGFRRILRSKNYHKLQEYIIDFPQSLIYFSRFFIEIGPAVNFLSGIAGLSNKIFFIFDFLGETSYVFLYVFTGYFLGAQWENNLDFLPKLVLAIIPIGIAIALVQKLLFKRKRR